MTVKKQIMRFSILLMAVFCAGGAMAQTGNFNNLRIYNNLNLKGKVIYNFNNDSAMVVGDSTSLPTTWAVKNYFLNRLRNLVIATGNTFVVSSESEMLATAAVVGDVAVRTDSSKSYILRTLPATDLSNWVLLLFPANVMSVMGRTGVVTAQAGDYDHTQITGLDSLLAEKALRDSVYSKTATDNLLAAKLDAIIAAATYQPIGQYATGTGTANGTNTGDQDLSGLVPKTTTVNGQPLSSNVVISASDITTGTLPHAQLPGLVTADIPNLPESKIINLESDLLSKQPTLVSGTNIKTINNVTLLGSGNIDIPKLTHNTYFNLTNNSGLGVANYTSNYYSSSDGSPINNMMLQLPGGISSGMVQFYFVSAIDTLNYFNPTGAVVGALTTVKAGDFETLMFHPNDGKWYVVNKPNSISGNADSLGGYPASFYVDTTRKDTTETVAPIHTQVISGTHRKLYVDVSTDSTLGDASDTTLASSLAVKSALKVDSTVLQNSISLKQNIITNLGDTSKYAKSGVGSSNYLQKVVGVNLLGNSSIQDSAGIRMTPDTIKGITSGNGLILNQVWTTTSSSPVLFQGNATAANGGVLIDLRYNGVSEFKVTSGGNTTVGNTITSAGGFIGQKLVSTGGSSTAISSFLTNISFNPITTGNSFGYKNTDGFNDSTGNANYTAFDFSGSIYQGLFGTATGTTRGLFIHPSLTNPHDWRSIEFNNNVGKGIYQTGSAPNSFAGKTGFYSDTLKAPTASVEVAPTSTSAGGGAFKIDGGSKVTIPENGLIENDNIGNHLLWTNNSGVRLQIDKQGIDTVNSVTAMVNYSGLPNLIYLTDTLQGGWFYYAAIGTVDNGTIFTATGKGSGKWVRVFDKTKGINIDWFGGRDENAIRSAATAAGTNGIINFTPNKVYVQKGRVRTGAANQTFNGNNAVLQRGNDVIVTLSSVSLITDSTITVTSVPANWSTLNGYVQLFTDTTDFSSSTLLSISTITGNTIKFSTPLGGLYNPDASHPQITQWGIGTMAHLTYNQIEDNGTGTNNFSVYNLTFDGNKTNNNGNHSWRINTTIQLHGNESQATIDHCKFINIPNENIMGHGFHVTDNYAKNLNGSFVHLSANYLTIPPLTPSFINGNLIDSVNIIKQIITNHSEGAITYSNTSGYVNITNNRFYNGGDAVFGVIQSGGSTNNGGVRDMNIQGNYAENFSKIFYNTNISDPTGLPYPQGHIFIDGNTFNKCGTTDWTAFQANINKSDTIMVGNNLLVGGTVWNIPVQNSDASQRYILNNSTSTAQGGSINVTGTVKGSNIITITTGTAAPTIIPAKIGDEFLDTTNKKYYKAFGTSSSADWVIMN